MPSLDFIRDICDQLKTQDIDYYILAIQKSKPEARIDTFIRISDISSANALEKNEIELIERMKKAKESIIEKKEKKKIEDKKKKEGEKE